MPTNASETKPVVVLTAGGAGRSTTQRKGHHHHGKSKRLTKGDAEASPEARESRDSFLDQPEQPPVGAVQQEPVAPPVDVLSTTAAPVPPTSHAAATTATAPVSKPTPSALSSSSSSSSTELLWLLACFLGIMASFVCYGLLLEYATSGGRKLHELSFLFVTSGLYTLTAAAGRYVRDETPTTIPPARFAVLGLTSMGSTFFSVRSLRCVGCWWRAWLIDCYIVYIHLYHDSIHHHLTHILAAM